MKEPVLHRPVECFVFLLLSLLSGRRYTEINIYFMRGMVRRINVKVLSLQWRNSTEKLNSVRGLSELLMAPV